MNKKALLSFCILGSAVMFLASCASKVETLPISPRDEEKYNNEFITKSKINLPGDNSETGIVWQTKGSGRCALVNLGRQKGVRVGTKIEFFTVKKKGGNYIKLPFAYGRVISAEQDTCWVDVKSYKKAGVLENNFARIAPNQSKSFFETVNPVGPTGWISGGDDKDPKK